MSSSHSSSEVSRSKQRSRYFLVDPLSKSLDEDASATAAKNNRLQVGEQAAVSLKPANPLPAESQAQPETAQVQLPAQAPAQQSQDPTIQALEAADFSGRLLQGIVEEFQAAGRLPITVDSRPVETSGVETSGLVAALSNSAPIRQPRTTNTPSKRAAAEALELVADAPTDEFAGLFDEIEQADNAEQARVMEEMAVLRPILPVDDRFDETDLFEPIDVFENEVFDNEQTSEDIEAAAAFDALAVMAATEAETIPTPTPVPIIEAPQEQAVTVEPAEKVAGSKPMARTNEALAAPKATMAPAETTPEVTPEPTPVTPEVVPDVTPEPSQSEAIAPTQPSIELLPAEFIETIDAPFTFEVSSPPPVAAEAPVVSEPSPSQASPVPERPASSPAPLAAPAIAEPTVMEEAPSQPEPIVLPMIEAPVSPTPSSEPVLSPPPMAEAPIPASPVAPAPTPEPLVNPSTVPSSFVASTNVDLSLLNGTQTLNGQVGTSSDSSLGATYAFSLDQLSDFNLVLEGLNADASVALLDDQGNVLQTANRDGASTELLGSTLAAGNYQLQITADQTTDYRLVLSATPDSFGTANNLQVSAATYLGGEADDTASAVEFSPQRELVVAGNFGMAAVGAAAERSLLSSTLNSAGQIVRLSASGQEVLSITHLGNELNDMDVNRASGTIVAGGDFGIAVLNAAADQVLWSQDLGGATVDRVAIANNGTVVTLHNKTVTIWSPDGAQLAQTTLNRSYVEDVAIDPDTGAIYVAGYDNKYNNVDGNPVQVAFLTGFDGNLDTKWSSWGYDADTLTDGQNDMADTRGYRITIGRDGQLYFLGEVAGGNSVFRWNGKDRSTETLVKYDAYNDPYNSKSPHQTYYARINPDTGEVLQGQLAIARLSNGASNAVRVYEGSITADEAGNVYIGGRAFSGLAGRDQQTINGQAVGDYTKSDPFALVVSSDFQSRRNWTTFVQDGARGSINGFAVGEGRAAVLGTIDQGSVITQSAINANAFNAADTDTSDVYLATWGTDTLFEGDGSLLDVGKTITGFSSDSQLQLSAANFQGLQPGALSQSAFVLGSQPQNNRATLLYDGGVLSFDADGTGSQQSFEVARLQGNPSLEAQQILVTS